MAQKKPQRMNIIGSRVRSLRTLAGLTREELAALIDAVGGELSAEEVERVETGERGVLDDEVLHLARALGVTVDDMFPKHRR